MPWLFPIKWGSEKRCFQRTRYLCWYWIYTWFDTLLKAEKPQRIWKICSFTVNNGTKTVQEIIRSLRWSGQSWKLMMACCVSLFADTQTCIIEIVNRNWLEQNVMKLGHASGGKFKILHTTDQLHHGNKNIHSWTNRLCWSLWPRYSKIDDGKVSLWAPLDPISDPLIFDPRRDIFVHLYAKSWKWLVARWASIWAR